MQKKLTNKKVSSLLLCMMLIVAMALTTIGCGGTEQKKESSSSQETEKEETLKDNVLGEGDTKFFFTVVDQDGKEEKFEIHTSKKTVGEALIELDLIQGEDSEYGLYVKTVNGITVDFDKDGKYWAFYVGDEYASKGVELTEIVEGESYSFRVE